MPPEHRTYQSRIVGYSKVNPAELNANPYNWRVHTPEQIEAVRAALSEIGVIQNPIRNIRTGFLIDGHLRVQLAVEAGVDEIEVTDVDLEPMDEMKAVATFDKIGLMAETNDEKLLTLHAGNTWDDPALKEAMDQLVASILPASVLIDQTDSTPAPPKPDVAYFMINLSFREPERNLFYTAIDIAKQSVPDGATPIDALMAICSEIIAT